jgi:hypothetical protein
VNFAAFAHLPGAELVLPGLRDAAAGRLTVGSCLVSMAQPTLEQSGLLHEFPQLVYVDEPERALYRLLQQEGANAYGRYNSLLRRLTSFERSLRSQCARDSVRS